MAAKDKNTWICLVFVLSGLVIRRVDRGINFRNKWIMVVILWKKFWTRITNGNKFICYYNHICFNDKNKYSKYIRNGDRNIFI